eukprot:g4905.t1
MAELPDWEVMIRARSNRTCEVVCRNCIADCDAKRLGKRVCTFKFSGTIPKDSQNKLTILKAKGRHGDIPIDGTKKGVRRMATALTKKKLGVTAQSIQLALFDKTGNMPDLARIQQAVKDTRRAAGAGSKRDRNYEEFERIAKARKV